MVAAIALIVAVVSLGWNVVLTFIRWPRLSVIGQHKVVASSRQPMPTNSIRLIVVNHGAEPTTVADVGFALPIEGEKKRITWSIGGLQVISVDRDALRIEGPEFPARVEGHGSLTWNFEDEDLNWFKQGAEFYPFVVQYRRAWRFRGTQYRSPRREVRGRTTQLSLQEPTETDNPA